MEKYVDAPSLYNLLNQGIFHSYTSDPYYLLLLDVRNRNDYEEEHIINAIHLKTNENDEFVLPFDIGLEWKWNIFVYDKDTFHAVNTTDRLCRAIEFLYGVGAFTKVKILQGGYKYFTKLYPFMRTKTIVRLPKVIEAEKTFPLEVVRNFMYLVIRPHADIDEVSKCLDIFGKIYCSQVKQNSEESNNTDLYVNDVNLTDDEMYKFMVNACDYSAFHSHRGHRILIISDKHFSRGAALAMAYLISKENKTLKEAWAQMRRVCLPMRIKWSYLELLALVEQEKRNLSSPMRIVDEDFQ